MGGRHTAKPQPAESPTANHFVAAGAQLINELVKQLQARASATEIVGPPHEQLMHRIKRLKARIRGLEECVVFLASAVGTCAACFGKMPECPVCNGVGQPGKLTVDPVAYSAIVAPLFEQQPERLKELVAKYAWADPAAFSQIAVPGLDQPSDSVRAPDHESHFGNTNGDRRRLDTREGPRHGR